MKGIILSGAAFLLYILGSIVVSNAFRPTKYSRVFLPATLFASIAYLSLFALTPASLGFLPGTWQAAPAWFDCLLGWVVLLLNIHSFFDFFWAFNGGFSMSLIHEIHKRWPGAVPTGVVVRCFIRPDGLDKIYGWRLPKLAETGMLSIDPKDGTCRLTERGARVAKFAAFCKRMLNLGKGG